MGWGGGLIRCRRLGSNQVFEVMLPMCLLLDHVTTVVVFVGSSCATVKHYTDLLKREDVLELRFYSSLQPTGDAKRARWHQGSFRESVSRLARDGPTVLAWHPQAAIGWAAPHKFNVIAEWTRKIGVLFKLLNQSFDKVFNSFTLFYNDWLKDKLVSDLVKRWDLFSEGIIQDTT